MSELRPAAGGAGRLSQNDQRSGLRCFLEEIQMVGIQILGPGEWMSEEKTKMVSCLVANGADICNAPASICHFPWSSSGPLQAEDDRRTTEQSKQTHQGSWTIRAHIQGSARVNRCAPMPRHMH